MSATNPLTEAQEDALVHGLIGVMIGAVVVGGVAVGAAMIKRKRDGAYPYPVGNRPPPDATNVGTTDYKGVPITTYQVPGYGWAAFFVWKGPSMRPGGIADGQPLAGWWYNSQGEALKDLYADVDDMLKTRAQGVGTSGTTLGPRGVNPVTGRDHLGPYAHPTLTYTAGYGAPPPAALPPPAPRAAAYGHPTLAYVTR